MLHMTKIARVRDALPLSASADGDDVKFDDYSDQAKRFFKELKPNSPNRCTLESGPYCFHYVIDRGVCFLVLTERNYPRKMAFAYLDELVREFFAQYENEYEEVTRPYSYIKFDSVIQRFKRTYEDTRNFQNTKYDKLKDDLQDVHSILTRNIQDVLGRGEGLEKISSMSSRLSVESQKYTKNAEWLNQKALIQTYAPVALLLIVILGVIYYKFFL